MLGFNKNQNVQPLYDYYVETDLDSFDDQPVDYSKKYTDQDTYEDYRRRKSILKTNQFSPEVSQTIKQSCNDEVKVYCIEGTPLTISSASSFCDLRDVGTNNIVEKPDIKHFPSVNEDGSPESFNIDIKKDSDSPSSKKEEEELPLSKEKDDIKEGKSVSFRNSTDISKASSPLMFSRSSSVGSLNSFEQQSIVDDRSSVSVFSAFTSGLISPSDLPDSPGDIMSPALTDKDSSPKIDVNKLDSDSECENIELGEKGKADPDETLNNDVNNETLIHVQLPKECIPLDSDRNSEEEDHEILAQQLKISNDSLDIDEVFNGPNYETNSFALQNEEDLGEQLSKSGDESDADDILLLQCIQLGMPSSSKEKECDVKPSKRLEYQPLSQSISASQECIPLDSGRISEEEDNGIVNQQLEISNDSLDMDEEFDNPDYENNSFTLQNEEVEISEEIIVHNSELSGVKEDALTHDVELESSKSAFSKTDANSSQLVSKTDDAKSDHDSDEDDEILQRCIQLGMPENTSKRNVTDPKGFKQKGYSSQLVSYNSENDLSGQACAKSDDEYDGDDVLLQQCIQMGMPKQPSENKISNHVYKRTECHTVPIKTNSSHVHFKSKSKPHHHHIHSNRSNMMPAIPAPCIQYRTSHKMNEKMDVHTKPVAVRYPPPVKKPPKHIPRKIFPLKMDAEWEGFENTLQIQQYLQSKMSKEDYEKKIVQAGVFRKPECDPTLLYFHPLNDMRDNCPDGVSDGDEDDELLEKCISAGLPSPKPTNDIQNKLHLYLNGHTYRKQAYRPYMPDTSSEPSKKYNPVRLPQSQPYAPVHSSTAWISNTSFIDVDSMRIYRTEDTPILSPTASVSDLSSLSFNESFLNNSRNSDCSSGSDDDDDELLQRCIRSGMPEAKRAVA